MCAVQIVKIGLIVINPTYLNCLTQSLSNFLLFLNTFMSKTIQKMLRGILSYIEISRNFVHAITLNDFIHRKGWSLVFHAQFSR